jgi:hypothetical protein
MTLQSIVRLRIVNVLTTKPTLLSAKGSNFFAFLDFFVYNENGPTRSLQTQLFENHAQWKIK